jgi:hypothetical protein
MADTTSNTDYYKTNVAPAKSPDELSVWWFRDIQSNYSAYKVKLANQVQSRGEKKDVLVFRFAAREDLGPFEVDLKDQPSHVWPDLPSTIQFATSERPYGFLFLTQQWTREQTAVLRRRNPNEIDLKTLAEGGGKWPSSALDSEKLKMLIEQIKDKGIQAAFMSQLGNHLK